jgi:2-methylcitrate dehydratase PrpD
MNETRQLAEWVAATGYDDLPADVLAAVKIYILDDLAAGFAGCRTAWADMAAGLVQGTSVGPCSLFARSWTTSASAAALVNGVMVGGFECDHPFSQGNCHPSVAVFPALLAIAEQEHLDGRTFLTATSVGYEALCRIGVAATRAVEDERGFHGPGTNAAFGSAAAVGKALGFTGGTLTNALGIAGSHGGGLLEFFREGAMTKRMHIGRGSQMGLESALLAAQGFTGPSTVLEGEQGFFHAYSPSPRPELLLEGIGDRYLLHGLTLKAYPCHVSFQAVVDVIQRFRETADYEPQEITSLRIRGSGRFFEDRFGERRPTTLMGAQYSVPWSTALSLCRDVADPRAWSEDDLDDPAVGRLAQLLELQEEPMAGAEIEVAVKGASHTLAITDWKGAPTNPYTYDDAAAKLARYAGPYLAGYGIDDIVARVATLENDTDVATLAASIRG